MPRRPLSFETLAVSPFELHAGAIEALREDDVVRLVNTLIWDEGRRLDLPASVIRVTLRTRDPDGGIDALTDVSNRESRYLRSGEMVWQFKKSWPDVARLRDQDLAARAAREAFERGAGYTLVVGESMVPRTLRNRLETLKGLAEEAGCRGPVQLFDAEHIARWTSSVPGAHLELVPSLLGYQRADRVLADRRHSTPFEPDAARREAMAEIVDALFSETRTSNWARIQGAAGVGKTRLALETVTAAGLSALALYSPRIPGSELFSWVASKEAVHVTVIVDECDELEARPLEQWADQCGGRLQLLTVGRSAGTGGPVYTLGTLSQEAMEKVVRSTAATLDSETVRWVAQRTGGYVKLAVAVARAIARGSTSIAEMSSDRDVLEVILRLIAPGDDARRALEAVALLTRVGWEGEPAEEGRAVAAFLGADWNRVQQDIRPSMREGIVVAKGRYRYVSPELLALWLSAEVWRTQAYRIRELYDALPGLASREGLLDRLQGLGGILGVQEVLEELLGKAGAFRSLADIDNSATGRLFAAIAKGAPSAALVTLERLIEPASREELLAFRHGRREVVWALERLLERRETFLPAARLLRRLAEAENEDILNNATGVWQAIFLAVLAPTEVPALERFTLVEEALTDGDAVTRLLAVRGLSAALEDREVGLPLHERSRDVPRPHWRSGTWGDVQTVKRRALELLDRALQDGAAEVRQEALRTFTTHARGLVRIGLGEEVVDRFRQLDSDDHAVRRHLWETMTGVIAFEGKGLSEAQKAILEDRARAFFGDSLADRIRRYAGQWSFANEPDAHRGATDRLDMILGQLAEEAVKCPRELMPLLAWLTSGEAENVVPFGRRLGELDTDRQWLDPILDVARTGEDPRLLSGYLAGRARAGDAAWTEELLDTWARDPALARIVFDATARGRASDHAAVRIAGLVERGWLQPESLGWLRLGGWVEDLSASALAPLIRFLCSSGSGRNIESGLALLEDWAHEDPGRLQSEIEQLAWSLIETSAGWKPEGMLSYHWTQVAELLLRRDPLRVAMAVVRTFTEGGVYSDAGRSRLLAQALSAQPHAVWGAIGETLVTHPASHRLAWALEETSLVSSLPPSMLAEWVRERGEDAAQMVARSIKPPCRELPEIVRFLLANYPEPTGATLAANFMSGVWWGSQAEHLTEREGCVQPWLEDQDPAVRAWARGLLAVLQRARADAQLREAEEALP